MEGTLGGKQSMRGCIIAPFRAALISDPYLFAEPDDLWARTLKEDLNAAQGNRYVDAELERNEGREAEGDG